MAGHSLAYLAREHDIALVVLDRAVALNPSSAPVMAASGWVRAYIGDSHTAMDHFKRAIRLSPLAADELLFRRARDMLPHNRR
jgi:Flp pilus assembly protein TadD